MIKFEIATFVIRYFGAGPLDIDQCVMLVSGVVREVPQQLANDIVRMVDMSDGMSQLAEGRQPFLDSSIGCGMERDLDTALVIVFNSGDRPEVELTVVEGKRYLPFGFVADRRGQVSRFQVGHVENAESGLGP